MEHGFHFCDELGPEKIINIYQPELDLKGILAMPILGTPGSG